MLLVFIRGEMTANGDVPQNKSGNSGGEGEATGLQAKVRVNPESLPRLPRPYDTGLFCKRS